MREKYRQIGNAVPVDTGQAMGEALISAGGKGPEEYIEQFETAYGNAENRLLREFTTLFCQPNGSIDWNKLIKFNSGSQKSR